MSSNELKRVAKKVLPKSAVQEIRRIRKARRRKQEPKPNTYQGQGSFTVVSAIYNVEKYLDDYFASLYNQTLTKDRIFVIAVDDGSTDGSAEIIKKWQEKWPDAITYLKKENGGQASARNLGMKHVETEWVTFIDPDDFVSKRYFEEVDRAIAAWPSVQLLSCNTIFYREESHQYDDAHPLRERFAHGDKFFAVNDESRFIQLSMSSAFLRMSVVNRLGIEIDERIRPNFEDGHFVNRYLLLLDEGTIGFLRKPRYYYRKRQDGTSTLDTSWETLNKILDVPRYGYLSLLREANATLGYIPSSVQRTVLYDLSFTIKRFLGHPERCSSDAYMRERGNILGLLGEIFSLIDEDEVMNFPGRWLHFGQKVGIVQFFCHREPPYQIAYIRTINMAKKEMLIETCSEGVSFRIDGKPAIALETKISPKSFLGEVFYSTYEHWISYESENQVLSYSGSHREPTRLSVDGKQYKGSVAIRELLKRYTREWGEYAQQGDVWIIMDRDTQADDNGEHFYRYMKKNHPDQECYFALRRDSADWDRLCNEGFNLLEFGSKKHEKMLKSCSTIISAHADAYVHSYFGDNFHQSKKYVFLQHGVIKDDLSSWLNGKPIDLMLTSTLPEWHSIVDDGSAYVLTSRQVACTGLPRHDHLIDKCRPSDQRETSVILVAPTWRRSLLGAVTGKGNERFLSPEFESSKYRNAWLSFLASDRLKEICDAASAKVVFFPHANMLPYIDEEMFRVPEHIEIGRNDGTHSIQDYFAEASVCITDYSSTSFECALLDKEVVYYQFDKEEFYSGGQFYARGYFDFEKDGFGPVAYDEDALLDELEALARRDFAIDPLYKKRIDETFIYRDGKCCERVYNAIKALDEPRGH